MLHVLALPLTLLLIQSPQQPSPQQPSPARQLTLREALTLAVQRNLALARAQAEVPAANAGRRATLSAVLPRFSVGGVATRNSLEVTFGPPEDVRAILPRADWNWSLSLSQPIFAGLRDLRAYRQSKIGVDIAREGVRQTSDAVLLTTSQQFLLALEAEALIEVERQNLQLAETRRQQAQDLFDAGETTRVDVLRAEADIKAAERRVVEAERSREVAVSALRIALAIDEDLTLVEPAGGERAVPEVPSQQELVSRALGARPEVRQAGYALENAQLEVKLQKGAYLPIVTADAGFIKQKRTFPASSYGFASLNVTVPIYQGGEVGARVALAEEREKQANLALEEVERSVREDVRIALFDLEASRTNLALAEEQLQAAEAEYQQTFELYQNQELTTLDVQASEAALADARRGVATGRLLVYAAEVRAWYVTGSLTEVALSQESQP
jgi:outer membrane protein